MQPSPSPFIEVHAGTHTWRLPQSAICEVSSACIQSASTAGWLVETLGVKVEVHVSSEF